MGSPYRLSSVKSAPVSGWLSTRLRPVNWIAPTPLNTIVSIVTRATSFVWSVKPAMRDPFAVKTWMRWRLSGASAMTNVPSDGSRAKAVGSMIRPGSAPTSMTFLAVSPTIV